MSTGRTLKRYSRFYMGGYDLSGNTNVVGPLVWEYEPVGIPSLTEAVRGYLPDTPNISLGDFKGIFDSTASTGLHTIASGYPGSAYDIIHAIGIRAAPAEGDPAFCGKFALDNYLADPSEGMIGVLMKFGLWDASDLIDSHKPWGVLLHESSAETGANTATGVDDYGAATALGGYMAYQVLAGDGTATLKVQDAATNENASFADITGATSGELDCSAVQSGIVALGTTATVRRYLRWQLSLNTATTVTFVLAFVRETRS